MPTTKNGKSATKVRGLRRIYLIEDLPGLILSAVEIKPGLAVQDIDTSLVEHPDTYTFAILATATRRYVADFEDPDRAWPGWYVAEPHDAIGAEPLPNRRDALAQIRRILGGVTNWHWSDKPQNAASRPATPTTDPSTLETGTVATPIPDFTALVGRDVAYRQRTAGRLGELKVATVESVRTAALDGERVTEVAVRDKALSMHCGRTVLIAGRDEITPIVRTPQTPEAFEPGDRVRTADGRDAIVARSYRIGREPLRVETTDGLSWVAENCSRIPMEP